MEKAQIFTTVALIIYALLMTTIGLVIGLSFKSALFHGICNYLSSWSTCGFTPMSQSILYYHSELIEIALMVCMILGVTNFMLHFT